MNKKFTSKFTLACVAACFTIVGTIWGIGRDIVDLDDDELKVDLEERFAPQKIFSNCHISTEDKEKINLGREFLRNRKYRDALRYFKNISSKSDSQCVKAKATYFAGDSYKKLNLLQEARISLNSSKKYFEKYVDEEKNLGLVLKSLGEIEIRAHNYDVACEYLNNAKDILIKYNQKKELDSIKKFIAKIELCI